MMSNLRISRCFSFLEEVHLAKFISESSKQLAKFTPSNPSEKTYLQRWTKYRIQLLKKKYCLNAIIQTLLAWSSCSIQIIGFILLCHLFAVASFTKFINRRNGLMKKQFAFMLHKLCWQLDICILKVLCIVILNSRIFWWIFKAILKLLIMVWPKS